MKYLFCRLREFPNINEIGDIPRPSLIEGSEGMHTALLPVLPDWVLEKPHMVCPPKSVTINKRLGSGQYGTVYKGCYIHGNAR